MDKRSVGLLVLIVAIALLVVSTVTKSWWSTTKDGATVDVGLTSVNACIHECDSVALKEVLPKEEKVFVTFGAITLYGGYVLAIGLGLVLFLAMIGQSPSNVVSPSRVTSLLSIGMALCSIIFVVLVPDEFEELKIGYSFPMYLVGALCGLAGSVLLSPISGHSTTQGQYTTATVQQSPSAILQRVGNPVPACPTCGAPTRLVAEHGRHMCERCQVYV